jgi:hypothetical protein
LNTQPTEIAAYAYPQQIDANLDALHGAAKRLNGLGRAMGQEVDEQNKHIDRIIGKVSQHSVNIFIW